VKRNWLRIMRRPASLCVEAFSWFVSTDQNGEWRERGSWARCSWPVRSYEKIYNGHIIINRQVMFG
jgi:hypothetical protein